MLKQDVTRWRGLKSLVHDAVDATTQLVEIGHDSTMRSIFFFTDRVESIRRPVRYVDAVRRVSTGGVLSTIRGVNQVVAMLSDSAIDAATSASGKKAASGNRAATGSDRGKRSNAADSETWATRAALGVINAAVGDHLSDTENALDLTMALRLGDHYVDLDRDSLFMAAPEARPKLALFVHGLGTTESSWGLDAEADSDSPRRCFGSKLEHDLGFTAAYLRYNTGRSVSRNGRLLADALERFVHAYPVRIEDLTMVGHSMGGLVLRSACHYGELAGHAWPSRVRRIFYLGTPHRGAPLSKLSHALGEALDSVDLPATQIIARIVAGRSTGIQDLREGSITDDEYAKEALERSNEMPLLPDARHYFISATVTDDPRHPIGRVVGDLLVRVTSSQGPAPTDASPAAKTIVLGGLMHHELQKHASVYEQIRLACRTP